MTKRAGLLLVGVCGLLAAAPLWAQVGPGGVVGGGRGGVVGGTTTKPGITLGPSPRSGTISSVDAAPVVPIVAAKTFPSLASDPIERPEFNDKPKPVAKNITTATAMMIIDGPDGEMGLTADVIASVVAGSRSGTTFSASMIKKQAAVGPEMTTSFDEAVRAVGMRYPKMDPARIEFSFGDKYTPHEGGSAGTCFAVMLLSEIEGFDIDSKVAVTGDITVDWKVRKIGGLAAKVRGATADKCLYTGVPLENREQVYDMALFYGDVSLRDIQVFSLDTLQDAVALLRKDRSPQLVEAMKEFAELRPKVTGGRGTFSQPGVVKVLENIIALAPNHESAKMMLEMAKGTFPRTLSQAFAFEQLRSTLNDYRDIIVGIEPVNRQTVTAGKTQAAIKALNQLSPIAPAELQPIINDTRQIVNASEQIAAGRAKIDILNTQVNNFKNHMEALSNNKEFVDKLFRGGI